LTRGEQLKYTKKQYKSVLVFMRETPGICPVCPMFKPSLLCSSL